MIKPSQIENEYSSQTDPFVINFCKNQIYYNYLRFYLSYRNFTKLNLKYDKLNNFLIVILCTDQRVGKSYSCTTTFWFFPFPPRLFYCLFYLLYSTFLGALCPNPKASRFSSSPLLLSENLTAPCAFLSLFFFSYLVSKTVSFYFFIHSALISTFFTGAFVPILLLISIPLFL